MHTTINCPGRKRTSAHKGFTLVELMVTVALAAILMMLAIPSFTNQLRGWQRDSATKALTAHLQLARSEAIKTSRRVVMCSSTNGTACAESVEWSTGWIVFIDGDGDEALGTGETTLVSRGASTGLASMKSGIKSLSFMPNGLLASNPSSFEVIPLGRGGVKFNKVTINRIGRAYVTALAQKA